MTHPEEERLSTEQQVRAAIEAERARYIDPRRARAGIAGDTRGTWGLALSGGGIRSATFCLGLVRGLARNRVLKEFDYLSTVSGGGYLGASLGRLYREKDTAGQVEENVARDDSMWLWWLRNNGRYLTPGRYEGPGFCCRLDRARHHRHPPGDRRADPAGRWRGAAAARAGVAGSAAAVRILARAGAGRGTGAGLVEPGIRRAGLLVLVVAAGGAVFPGRAPDGWLLVHARSPHHRQLRGGHAVGGTRGLGGVGVVQCRPRAVRHRLQPPGRGGCGAEDRLPVRCRADAAGTGDGMGRHPAGLVARPGDRRVEVAADQTSFLRDVGGRGRGRHRLAGYPGLVADRPLLGEQRRPFPAGPGRGYRPGAGRRPLRVAGSRLVRGQPPWAGQGGEQSCASRK